LLATRLGRVVKSITVQMRKPRFSCDPARRAGPTYGWNLEMSMRVAAAGLPVREIPVGQRRRLGGASKVSGNFTAGLKATQVMMATFIRLALRLRRDRY
jgi:hypothetical protein